MKSYAEPLTPAGEVAAATLVDAGQYGGAVAYRANPCLVVYGVPCWIMPNGGVRVGAPNAPMVDAEAATRAVRALHPND